MDFEMLLFFVEVIYLWRALPFCSRETKQQLLDKLSAPVPQEVAAVHRALRAWLRGGLLNSLGQPIEAEKVRTGGLSAGSMYVLVREDTHIAHFADSQMHSYDTI